MAASGDSAAVIRQFLDQTDHAPGRGDDQYAGTLNPALRPRPDKRYPTLTALALPTEFVPSAMPAIAAIASLGPQDPMAETSLDRAAIARVAYFTNGITKYLRPGERRMAFRAHPTTGALYHEELYFVTGNLPDLPAGVYHYGAHDHALRQLRAGDFRQVMVDAAGGEATVAHAPAIMVVTSVFWRNAWKYAARAYRHAYWDVGTMLPNTFAVAAAAAIPTRLVLAFADQPIADLLDLDLDKEGIIALVALGHEATLPGAASEVTRLGLPIEPYSSRELAFPLIPQAHRATLLASGEEAAAWRGRPLSPRVEPAPAAPLIPLPEVDAESLPTESIETIIRRRGSTRRFLPAAITLAQLTALLDATTRGIPADALPAEGVPFNDLFLLVTAVTGLEPGTYLYHRDRRALEPLRVMDEAEARDLGTFLALDQNLGGDAAVDIYLLADLDPVLAAYGGRGYRLAQLGGALVAGKLYLAAYAVGLGATGLTFYDQAVSDAFAPRGAGRRVMFLIAIGVPAPPPVLPLGA